VVLARFARCATGDWPTPATAGRFLPSRRALAPKPFTTSAGPLVTPITAP
jgi:inner membrane protein involved in colicin E2 resistance